MEQRLDGDGQAECRGRTRETQDLEACRARLDRAEAALRAIEERNRVLGNSAPFGIFTTDGVGRLTGCNPKLADLLSLPEGPWESINVFELDAFVEAGAVPDFRRCIAQKASIVREVDRGRSGAPCSHLRIHMSPILDGEAAVTGLIAFIEDATGLKEAQRSARESASRYRLLFQSAPVAMVERDASALRQRLEELQRSGVDDVGGYLDANPDAVPRLLDLVRTVDCNQAFLDLLEIDDRETLLRDPFPLSVFGDRQAEMARGILAMVHGGRIQNEREMTVTTLKGRRRRIMTRAMVLAGHETNMARVVISMVDITKRTEAEAALRASEQRFRELALRDNLTGLFNQRYLYQSLQELVQSSLREGSPLSVLFMDLDHFKPVVDAHGHLNGSRIIREVAATIRSRLREPAYAVAYAGDEFVVVLPGSDVDQAAATALDLLDRIRENTYLGDVGQAVRIQASAGIATCPDHAADWNALLAAADQALFQTKGTAKGAIRIFAAP